VDVPLVSVLGKPYTVHVRWLWSVLQWTLWMLIVHKMHASSALCLVCFDV